jgi:2-oxoglutarate ferredoxin oxidoreductase subunit beta
VDIFQPCVSFNKVNTYQWFKENTYYLESSYDPSDRTEAFKRACEPGKYPLGVFYVNKNKKTFNESLPVYSGNPTPLWRRQARGAAVMAGIYEEMK